MAYSRRGEQCSPVKKCDTYGIFVLFTDYKFIISTKDKIQIERLIFKRDINDVPYTCKPHFSNNIRYDIFENFHLCSIKAKKEIHLN